MAGLSLLQHPTLLTSPPLDLRDPLRDSLRDPRDLRDDPSGGSSTSSAGSATPGPGPAGPTGPAGPVRCIICLASFPSPWLLEQHMALQHAAYSSKYPSLAALSDAEAGEEKPFRCEVCGQSYRYRSAYLKHREQNHRARLPADKLFTCEVCGMQFRYLKSFKKHRLNHALEKLRSRSPSAECAPATPGTPSTPPPFRAEPISSTDYGSAGMAGARLLLMAGARTPPTPPHPSGRLTAPPTASLSPVDADADQVSSSNEAVGRSVERASSAPVSKLEHQNFYKFSLDDYYYLGSRSLAGEARPASRSGPKSDTEQDDTIDSLAFALSMTANGGADALRGSHDSLYNMLRQREERRFACPFCGKCVRSKENLKLHVRKHTGERPFVCLFCGRAFGGKSDLTRHLRIHTGERPYHCEMCGKCFARADYLSKHLTTHIHHSQRERGLSLALPRPPSTPPEALEAGEVVETPS